MSDLLKRIQRESSEDLIEVLAERLTPTDLQSLLLEVYKRRAAAVKPSQLLKQHEDNRFVRPSPMSPRQRMEFERIAFSVADPLFEPIELAPLSPLGTTASLTTVSQNNVVSTARNSEAISDPTNVMALECALRRKSSTEAANRIRLCCCQRVVRAQSLSAPKSWAHFLLFAMCSSGRDEGSYLLETEELALHIELYLKLFAELKSSGFSIGEVRVAISDFEGGTDTFGKVIALLDDWVIEAKIEPDPNRTSGRTYYSRLCFQMFVTDSAGAEHFLVDGGVTDWTQQLLSNRKERFLISGVGAERLCSLFAPVD